LITIFASFIFLFTYYNLESIAPQAADRIARKYDTRLHGIIIGENQMMNERSFLGQNIRVSLRSFYDNPMTGSGIGAFEGNFDSDYEVHSTYFKMLGEAGIIGFLAYFIFMFKLSCCLEYRARNNSWQEFIYYYIPFFIGCIISWAYTYHMRKREFWIMAAIITIIHFIIKYEIRHRYRSHSNIRKARFLPAFFFNKIRIGEHNIEK